MPQDTRLPFQIEADKQFIRDFGTTYFDGTYPSLGNPNPLPEIAKCCDIEPNIVKQTEVFVNELLPYIVISCPTCGRQSFKMYTKFGVKSQLPSEPQIRYWNSGKT